MNDSDDSAIKDIVKEIEKRRKHANWYEDSNKERKELRVVESLINGMKKRGDNLYHSPILLGIKEFPPDCILKDQKGNDVGVEVTELVDEYSVKEKEKGLTTTRIWNNEEVISEIEKILRDKDLKIFHGGSYSKKIVVIHTDEESILYDELFPVLESHTFSLLKQIDEAYLLFPYNPPQLEEEYPYIRLNIRKQIKGNVKDI